jgi:ABC-2 type transport system permease protein
MTTPSNAAPESFESQVAAPVVLAQTRPFYWSVRREVWENRSIYVAPLAVAAVSFLGFLVSLHGLARSVRALGGMEPVHQHVGLVMPYAHVAWLLLVTGMLVGVFYSIDALHGERRDRSILFWKSLPVSDLTTVLSKASIPLVVVPLVTFVVIVGLHLIMLVFSSLVLAMSGLGIAAQRTLWPLFQMELVLLYGLTVMALWHAPIYGWLLLVSGWARRATFLWVVLPPLVLFAVERVAYHGSFFGWLLRERFIGFAAKAFAFQDVGGVKADPHFIPLALLTPGKFLSSPGLWIGLIFAAVFLAAAARLRRYREPI